LRQVRDIITTIIIALIIFVILQVTVGSFKVYGQSMMPNIEDGNYILVDKTSYFIRNPHRGEIIIFHSPRDPESDLIKRIVGLPGDTIEIKGGQLFINNVQFAEDYILEPPEYQYNRREIPDDHYLVLGDNRNNSADSHNGWTVPRENIIGKAWLNYWPISNWEIMKHSTPSSVIK
jgi:signal peptidase I